MHNGFAVEPPRPCGTLDVEAASYKSRAYAIARGECVEAVAATEIAGEAGDAVPNGVAPKQEMPARKTGAFPLKDIAIADPTRL